MPTSKLATFVSTSFPTIPLVTLYSDAIRHVCTMSASERMAHGPVRDDAALRAYAAHNPPLKRQPL
jgi:hypothetical protein